MRLRADGGHVKRATTLAAMKEADDDVRARVSFHEGRPITLWPRVYDPQARRFVAERSTGTAGSGRRSWDLDAGGTQTGLRLTLVHVQPSLVDASRDPGLAGLQSLNDPARPLSSLRRAARAKALVEIAQKIITAARRAPA
jgi:hypothetical protein